MEPVSLQTHVALSPDRAEPLSVQLYRDLLAAIRARRLAGASLPSSRAAAAALGLSRNTVNAAYDLLRAEGAVEIRSGAAPRVVAGLVAPPAPQPAQTPIGLSPRGMVWASGGRERMHGALLSPGHPDETLFPRDEWARILRREARRVQGAAFGYEHYRGLPRLRQVLAERLAADRGMHLTPAQILITPGSQASLALLALALAQPGDRALIEDPGYHGARVAFLGAGLDLHPLPVDAEGAQIDGAPAARLLYLTPANQFPLGQRLSLARREAAIAYARKHKALIIEDDYDSEFLWRGRAIAAMQGRNPGLVIALGTVSKSLMPGLRLGWIVLPEALAEPLANAQRNLGLAANLHVQAALAEFITSGRYRAHLARIAHHYAQRGTAFAAALNTIPGVRVTPPDGGVQLTAHMAPEAETIAAGKLQAAGFGARPLSSYAIASPGPNANPGPTGLVIGFAEATEERARQFCKVLRAAIA
ncbi:MAG: PLP-dependent aminotransferase family protein, partial [Albidovulum sp.]